MCHSFLCFNVTIVTSTIPGGVWKVVDLIACMYGTDAGLFFFFDVVQLQALVLHDTVVGPMLEC